MAAVVPLVPAKTREGAGAWLLLRRCTVAAVVPLVPAKAREGAGAWVLLRRCTIAAVVPLVPTKATEGAGGWLLLRRQCCTVAAAVVSYERFRTITMTTTVLRRRPRETRRAHLRLVPGSSASLAPDSRSRAAEVLPQLLWLRVEQMLRSGMTVVLLINFHRLGRFVSYKNICICRSTNQCTNLDYLVQCFFAREGPVRLRQHLQYINRSSSPIRSLSLLRSPCSPLLTPRFPFPAVPVKACKPSNSKSISCFRGPGE